MQRRPFGKTGFDVSVIGFGGAPVGYLGTEAEDVAKILNILLDSGVNLIDTAAGYPGSEEVIGNVARERRHEFVLVTKCGNAGSDSEDPSWKPEAIAESIDTSLRRLQVDVLDVILLHSCTLETLQRGEAVGALVKARDAGKVRFAGYSGDNEAAAYAVDLPAISVIETSVNICDQASLDNVLPKARQKGTAVIAKRPIANASWKDIHKQPGLYQDYARTYTERFAKMGVDPNELGFASSDAQDAWPEIAIRFTLSQPGVHTAIIGTTNVEHAKRNLAAANRGPLPKETNAKLRDAFRSAERAAGENWIGQT